MSILGTVIRVSAADVDVVAARLGTMPGVELALDPGDGRMVVVIEDLDHRVVVAGEPASAAESLARIATWREVLSTSLVFEYSGPDAPPPEGRAGVDFRSWRDSLSTAARDAAFDSPLVVRTESRPSPLPDAPSSGGAGAGCSNPQGAPSCK